MKLSRGLWPNDKDKFLKRYFGHYRYDFDEKRLNHIKDGNFEYKGKVNEAKIFKNNEGFWSIGIKNDEVFLENNQTNCTCPEDCSSSNWKYRNNQTDFGSLVFNCSTFPGYKKSVKKCLEDFDVNNHPNRWLLPKNKCGRQRSGQRNSMSINSTHKKTGKMLTKKFKGYRITGGRNVRSRIDAPWMVVLHYNREDPNQIWGCGGALISKRYVLTAAHCCKFENNKSLEVDYVRLGEHSFATKIDCQVNDYSRNKIYGWSIGKQSKYSSGSRFESKIIKLLPSSYGLSCCF